MPRRARVPSKTGYYHVIMRGINREYIFKHQEYKQFYKHHLFHYQEEGKYAIVAWCIMDNHVHLVLYSPNLEVMSAGLHDLNQIFAQKYAKDFRWVGHVFQSRYKSENVEDDDYLRQVIRYVHNNPVKAKMVLDGLDYKWSSFNAYKQAIMNEQMIFAYSLFDNKWQRFYNYHLQEDEKEFLEIKEDLEKYRYEKAQKLIAEICVANGIYDRRDLQRQPEIMKNIISALRRKSGLSLEKIAKLLEVPYYRVQSNKSSL